MSGLSELEQVLQAGKLLCLDGASATELEKRGLRLDTPAWGSLALVEGENATRELYRDYFKAGVNIVTTPTYQACERAFKGIIGPEKLYELTKNSVLIAREEAARAPFPELRFVAASIGPFGATMVPGREYTGDYDGAQLSEIKAYHLPRLNALIEGEPDVLIFETIPNLVELKAISQLVDERLAQARRPPLVFVSLSLKKQEKTGQIVLADSSSMDAVAAAIGDPFKINAIGANCLAPRLVPDALRALKHVFNLPLLVCPNSGQSYNPLTQTWRDDPDDPDEWDLANWLSLGASLIGGCCLTGPHQLARVSRELHMFVTAARASSN